MGRSAGEFLLLEGHLIWSKPGLSLYSLSQINPSGLASNQNNRGCITSPTSLRKIFRFILYCIISYFYLATGSFCGHVLMYFGQTSDFFFFFAEFVISDSQKFFEWKFYKRYLMLFYFHVKISICYKLPVFFVYFSIGTTSSFVTNRFSKNLFFSSMYGFQFGIR